MKMFKWLFRIIILVTIAYLIYIVVYPFMVDVSSLKRKNPDLTAMMKYRIEQWEREGKKVKIKKVWVPLHKISQYLVKAVLIGEDDKFYKHSGFDIEGIKKAIEKDIKEKKLKYGGSTITQQLAKNLYLSPSKNPVRKIQEAIITWRLEKTLSKKRILELYLNVAEWGEGIFGAEAAARHYFGKSASELSPMEAARLAASLPNPIKYSPAGNSRFVEKRANLIYFIMQKRGIIKEEYTEPHEEESLPVLVEDQQNPSNQKEQSDQTPLK
ncbi:monofunctional biosynthetic peptidoglycan transglycosylase [Thermodesulfovibrio aggregans]|uniref:Biosynthetic peptidoglycan transglycosylase n=1 Tax=Thermodesulfovibrio aggregans TaxID=86166 RepID=A0A0U9HP23_9BACT|nr:monofunctional biosynthetic peptidoglycan transglycosylase [Thermodesulfovibrio aggregans]GAQ94612.1 monofunctional biosynthetic peptidoglycan transglycosylase [Thermodesulfovibrio aggregans]